MRGVALVLVAIGVAGWGLGGCGLAKMQEVQEEATSAKTQYNLDWADCNQMYPDRLAKPTSPRVACLGGAIVKYHSNLARAVGDPFVDLVETMNARAVEVAAEYDAGKKAQSQYLLTLATINTEYQNAVLVRMKHGVTTPAQQQAAAAANAVGSPSCTMLGNATPCF
jgi:hypothetical protein